MVFSRQLASTLSHEVAEGPVLARLVGELWHIHELNGKAQTRLTADNLLGYLRFFWFFVRGDDGPFLIAEGVDQWELPSTLTPDQRALLARTLRPARYLGEHDGTHRAAAMVYYGTGVFFADLEIQPGGMVEMLADYKVTQDLPRLDQVRIA